MLPTCALRDLRAALVPPFEHGRAVAPSISNMVRRRSLAVTDLLHRPAIAIGIAEEREGLSIFRVKPLHLGDIDTALDELGPSRLDIRHDQLQALTAPGSDAASPVPMTIEQAEPGVSCTTRTGSPVP